MRGAFSCLVVIGIVAGGYWFLNPNSIQGNFLTSIQGKFTKPKEEALEPLVIVREEPVDFSGLWVDEKTSTFLRVRKVKGGVVGEYAPPPEYAPADRAVLCRFQAKAEGETLRFQIKMRGVLWNCVFEREENTAVLKGRRDVDSLIAVYGMDGKTAGGSTMISGSKTPEKLRADAVRLQKKRQEIQKAMEAVVLGKFTLAEGKEAASGFNESSPTSRN